MRTKKASLKSKVSEAVEATVASAKKKAKAVGDKALAEIAIELPHGTGKEFLSVTKELDDIEGQMSVLNKRKRGCRARLKEMKIELRPYDHVRKLRKMDPVDMQSFEASVALYKDQLSMTLSTHQQIMKKEIEEKRERARDVMLDASGGDAGKEVGSGSISSPRYGATTDPELINAPRPPAFAQRPQKNEDITPPSVKVTPAALSH